MSDLIKRSDAIDAFVEETNGVNVKEAIKVVDAYLRIRECDEVWDSIRAIRDCLECAKDDIAEFIPSADRPQGEWIPCSERLPEKQTTVLYSLEGCVSVAFMTDRNYTGETVEWHWEDLETGITIYPEAWMPLPKPWKGADDE